MKKTALSMAFMAVTGITYATSGTNDYGYGIVSKGMGGTGVAQAQNAMSMAVNPANLSFMDDNADFGFAIFSPRREYEASYTPSAPPNPAIGFPGTFSVAPGVNKSGSNWFFVPYIALQKKIHEKVTLGISFYGNGGDNTNYPSTVNGASIYGIPLANGVYGGATKFPNAPYTGMGAQTGGNLRQMFINVPLAVKLNDQFSVAASFLTLAQTLSLEGLSLFTAQNPVTGQFYTTDPVNFSNRFTAVTFGFGGLFGATYHFNDKISLGGSYQMKIKPRAMKAYRGAFPNAGVVESPAKATVGVSVRPKDSIVVNVDYQRIFYSDTGAFGNPFACSQGLPCFGTPNGSGFGWDDTNMIKVGGSWDINQDYTLRAGYAHTDNPVKPKEVLLNIIAPAVVTDHYTIGLTRNFGTAHHLNLAFLYVPTNSTTGYNQFNPNQTIKLSMHQYEFGASWTWEFDKVMPAPTK